MLVLLPIEQRPDLLARAADGRGRSDDLRPDALSTDHARGKLIDGGLVETGNGAERSGNEMQLVLDDQIGRIERPAIVERSAFAPGVGGAVETEAFSEAVDVPEECAGLADPGQAREFVDGGDQEGRQAPVDRLVDGQDRQRTIAREVAGGVGAADLQVGRRQVVRNAGKGRRLERRAAPGARLDRRRRALVLAGLVAAHPPNRRGLVGVALAAQPVRRGVGADPEADLDRPVAELTPSLFVDVVRIGAHQLERAHDAGRARQLVEREQAQRVAHDNGDAGTEHARPGEPAVRDDEGCETEIGLGLAAAGREEQQVGNLAVGMLAIGKPGNVEKDEGELERPPFRRGLRRRISGRAGIAPPRSHGDGEVHVAEGAARDVVAGHEIDAFEDAPARDLHLGNEALGGLAAPRRQGGRASCARPRSIGRTAPADRQARRPTSRRLLAARSASASMPNVTRVFSSSSSFGATRSTSACGSGSVHTRVTRLAWSSPASHAAAALRPTAHSHTSR